MVADGGGEDLVKGAITDALKKAATLFGVGLHLYFDDPAPQGSSGRQHEARPRQGGSAPSPARNGSSRPPTRSEGPPNTGSGPAFSGQPMEDWNAFWPWARANGLSTKQQVEERLGRSMDGLNPAQVHTLLSGKAAAAADQPDPEAPTPLDMSRTDAQANGPACTQSQIGMLWREGRTKFGELAEDVLHAIAASEYGTGTLADLTRQQASEMIDLVQRENPASVLTALGIDPARLTAAGEPAHSGVGA